MIVHGKNSVIVYHYVNVDEQIARSTVDDEKKKKKSATVLIKV